MSFIEFGDDVESTKRMSAADAVPLLSSASSSRNESGTSGCRRRGRTAPVLCGFARRILLLVSDLSLDVVVVVVEEEEALCAPEDDDAFVLGTLVDDVT